MNKYNVTIFLLNASSAEPLLGYLAVRGYGVLPWPCLRDKTPANYDGRTGYTYGFELETAEADLSKAREKLQETLKGSNILFFGAVISPVENSMATIATNVPRSAPISAGPPTVWDRIEDKEDKKESNG